jgi:hypothetical protein
MHALYISHKQNCLGTQLNGIWRPSFEQHITVKTDELISITVYHFMILYVTKVVARESIF